MIGDYLVRWLYIKPGDMLEYRDRNGNIKQKGERINYSNCGECREINRLYCPKCVD